MLVHFLTLDALARTLRETLAGHSVSEAYSQSKQELILSVTSTSGAVRSLVFCLLPGMNAVFLREGRMRAKRNSVDIFPPLAGGTVSDVRAGAFTRELLLRTGTHVVAARLFNTASSNVFLSDAGGGTVSAFLGDAAGPGTGPGSAAGVQDRPEGYGGAPQLVEAIDAATGTLEHALKAACPWLGPVYRAEALFRAGLDGSTAAREGGAPAAQALDAAIGGLLESATTPEPGVYSLPGSDAGIFSVAPLRQPGAALRRSYGSVNEGVREVHEERRRNAELEEEKDRLLSDTGRELARVARSLEAARARADAPDGADDLRAAGNLILMRIGLIRKGMTEAALPDERGEEVTVRLDRSLTPAANAERYFEKARKAETAREENRARAADLDRRREALERLDAEIRGADDARDVRAIARRLRTGSGPAAPTAGGERLPYRVFPIGERFVAWVGKSSADNDELTFRHAGPHDTWMHVRGASGSHVVVRPVSGGRLEPPREVLRVAAKIAAYYSRMRKAGTVPVAYCERKYVRKPKHAPPGTVSLQREEIMFVEPGLP